jgi:transposase-like protein
MKKHTPEEIIPKLRVAELDWAAGLTIGQVCQKLGVSEQTFHRWRNQYGARCAESWPGWCGSGTRRSTSARTTGRSLSRG